MGVPILAFQIAGGIILFLFALTMIFGESKPEGEKKELRSTSDVAVFPLATPSLASPGAMMAVVLLTENSTNSIFNQMISSVIMLSVLAASYLFDVRCGLHFQNHWRWKRQYHQPSDGAHSCVDSYNKRSRRRQAVFPIARTPQNHAMQRSGGSAIANGPSWVAAR